ncbi:MAG TPA: HAD family hydrolase, partial [Rhizomicrobium sp.]|nr:HAD family hydrolase [Rhizomicrobium sp.]
MMALKQAAFFDRDGVINIDRGYVENPDQFDLVDGVGRAIRLCRDAGYLVFVVTNQAGVAHGYFDEDAVRKLHVHMRERLAVEGALVDDVRYCPHHPEAKRAEYRKHCSWRKPGAGMILDLAKFWPVDLSRSFLVGDKESDLEAARSVRMQGFLYSEGPMDRFV